MRKEKLVFQNSAASKSLKKIAWLAIPVPKSTVSVCKAEMKHFHIT